MENRHLIEILMIDDDEGDTFIASEALKEAKVANNFSVVHDGEEAIKFLNKEEGYEKSPRPDLIFLDLNMPKMNGLEVLDWIKANDNLKRIPVVVLTTSDSDEDVINSYTKYANCFIKKPVNFESCADLLKSIDDLWFGIMKLPPKET